MSQFIDDIASDDSIIRRKKPIVANNKGELSKKEFYDLLIKQGVDKKEIDNIYKLGKQNWNTQVFNRQVQKTINLKKSNKDSGHNERDRKFSKLLESKNPSINFRTTCIYETKEKGSVVKTKNLNSSVVPFQHNGTTQYRLRSICDSCGRKKSTFLSKELAGGMI